MQIFNVITNISTIIGAFVGCCMFYFTYKNHKWLVEDRKNQIEVEIRNKLKKIFSYVAQCLIDQQQIDEKVPKEICEFILNDINREISFLQKQKQASINAARQQVEFEKENFMMQNPNMMFSALNCRNIDEQYDNHFQSQEHAIEQNYIEKQQKVLKEEIISQYHNGTRLNDTDFNKLRSYFKDNKHIEYCYNALTKSP